MNEATRQLIAKRIAALRRDLEHVKERRDSSNRNAKNLGDGMIAIAQEIEQLEADLEERTND